MNALPDTVVIDGIERPTRNSAGRLIHDTPESGGLPLFQRTPRSEGNAAMMLSIARWREADSAVQRMLSENTQPLREIFESVGRLRVEREALAAVMARITPVAFEGRTRGGLGRFLTASAKHTGDAWQITRFDANGEPWGDSGYTNLQTACEEFLRDCAPESVRYYGDAVFRQAEPTERVGMSVAAVARICAAHTPPGMAIRVVPELDDLPAFVRAHPHFDAKHVRAVTVGETVYFVASRMPNAAFLRRSIAHEVIGHVAFERFLGPKLDEVLIEVQAMEARGEMPDHFAHVRKLYGDVDARTFAREVVAVLAERPDAPGFVERMVRWARAFLRTLGLSLTLQERDLRAMLARSRQSLETSTWRATRPHALAAACRRAVHGASAWCEHGTVSSVQPESIRGAEAASGSRSAGTVTPLPSAPVFMFAGERAQTADPAALASAKAMKDAGASFAEVWRELGWGQGVDGQWRFEIADATARWSGEPVEVGMRFGDWIAQRWPRVSDVAREVTLADLLDHPALFAAYPQLADVIVRATPVEGAGYGSNLIEVNADAELPDALSLLLHEVQHAVQVIEGFARGGHWAGAAREGGASDPALRERMAMFLQIDSLARTHGVTPAQFAAGAAYPVDVVERVNALTASGLWTANIEHWQREAMEPYVRYRHLAGEVEARNTQRRHGMPVEERRMKGPTETQDVAAAAQIVFQRASEPLWYSALLRAIEQGRGAPRQASAAGWQQWLDGAQRRGEFKADERFWVGVDEWIAAQDGRITREALADFVRANGVQVAETVLGIDIEALPDGWTVEQDRYGNWEVRNHHGTPVCVPPKYSQYTLPGGTNYRELLLTLPNTRSALNDAQIAEINRRLQLAGYSVLDAEQTNALRGTSSDAIGMLEDITSRVGVDVMDMADVMAGGSVAAEYRSRHWGQPNVLAHIRVNDRTDAEGKRVLFVEEIQSDWGQDGKKKGFAGAPARPEDAPLSFADPAHQGRVTIGSRLKQAEAARAQLPSMREAAVAAMKRIYASLGVQDVDSNEKAKEVMADESRWPRVVDLVLGEGAEDVTAYFAKQREVMLWEREASNLRQLYVEQVNETSRGKPAPAPFVTKTDGWLNLALKRVIAMAVDGGYDKVAFVTGEQSADRYDLSKQVERIEATRTMQGHYHIRAYKDGYGIFIDGVYEAEQLPNVIGKELAGRVAQRADEAADRSDLAELPEGYRVSMDRRSDPDNPFTIIPPGQIHGLPYAGRHATEQEAKDAALARLNRENDKTISLGGLDLKVGGEGLRAFYDTIVPKAVNALLKRLGGGQMHVARLGGVTKASLDRIAQLDYDSDYDSLSSRAQCNVMAVAVGEVQYLTQPSFDITDVMRERLAQPQPLFQRAVASPSSEWSLRDECVGAHNGQRDLRLTCVAGNGDVLGWVAYSVYAGEPSIQHIEVVPAYRRQGVATRLLLALQANYPDTEIQWGYVTGDGAMLYAALATEQVPNPVWMAAKADETEARQRLQAIEAAHACYLAGERDDAAHAIWQSATADWNAVSDAMEDAQRVLHDEKPYRILLRDGNSKATMTPIHQGEMHVDKPAIEDVAEERLRFGTRAIRFFAETYLQESGLIGSGVTVRVMTGEEPNGSPVDASLDKETRELVLNAQHFDGFGDAHAVQDAVEATVRHMVVGYFGLDILGQTNKRNVLEAVAASRSSPGLREIWDRVNAEYPDASREERAEHVFAVCAEKSLNGWVAEAWQFVLSEFARALRAVGIVKTPLTYPETCSLANLAARVICAEPPAARGEPARPKRQTGAFMA